MDFANVRSLWEIDPNLTGKGISISAICRSITYINDKPQNDFRFNMNHNSLYDADVSFADGTDGRFGISEHATSIAGIMLGLEDNATHPDRGTFNYRGTCPDASVNVYEFNSYLAQLYARLPIKEDIVVLSLGQMFEEWWTRALEQAAAEKDFLVVASVGNGASVYTPKPLYPGA
ncbi:MAG: S8/S53 family peptidase, partial [Planctomycetota bacterium]